VLLPVLIPSQVMAEVKALVRGGITICATIHSPTPFAFALFDSLMILLRGRVVYFGDRGAWPHAQIHVHPVCDTTAFAAGRVRSRQSASCGACLDTVIKQHAIITLGPRRLLQRSMVRFCTGCQVDQPFD